MPKKEAAKMNAELQELKKFVETSNVCVEYDRDRRYQVIFNGVLVKTVEQSYVEHSTISFAGKKYEVRFDVVIDMEHNDPSVDDNVMCCVEIQTVFTDDDEDEEQDDISCIVTPQTKRIVRMCDHFTRNTTTMTTHPTAVK
jgi:hypothetical protein